MFSRLHSLRLDIIDCIGFIGLGRGKGNAKANTLLKFHLALNNYYCWTHGVCQHQGAQCTEKAPGHIDTATLANSQGGLRQVWRRERDRNRPEGRGRGGGRQGRRGGGRGRQQRERAMAVKRKFAEAEEEEDR
jgi:hypothetical protein